MVYSLNNTVGITLSYAHFVNLSESTGTYIFNEDIM